MPGAAAIVVLLLSGGVLAGCLESGAHPPHGAAQTTDLARALAKGSASPWVVLTTSASADGEVAGYQWLPPAGSALPHDLGQDWWNLVLEVVPIHAGPAPPEWTLAIFEMGASAQLRNVIVAHEIETASHSTILARDEPAGSPMDPFHLSIPLENRTPPTFGFILTARGSGEFGIAFRVLDRSPVAAADSTFADVAAAGAADLLPLRGKASGVNFGLYAALNSLALIGVEVWTSDVEVHDGLPPATRPHATARDVQISSAFDRGGWSYGEGMYRASAAHGAWELFVASRGQEFEVRRLIIQDRLVAPLAQVEAALVGMPMYFFQGEGDEGSFSTFSLLTTNANVDEFLVFLQYDLGATIQDLLGIPAPRDGAIFSGLLGDVPPRHVEVDDGSLRLVGPDRPTVTIRGAIA